jgi:hypothetical protein
MGQWSELAQGIILEEKESMKERKELLIKKRSNLAAIKPGPTLLLFQVKTPFEGGTSIRSKGEIRSSIFS